MYKEFLIIFIIVIIHEIGHVLVSLIFKWHLDKIEIYPFGGCVKFNEKLNKPIIEELLILIGGPLIQIILFLTILFLYHKGIISFRNFILFKNYHYTLLYFNLLPIYPLDGGRILNCLVNYLFPFKKGNKLVGLLSILIIIFLITLDYKNINFILFGILLLSEIIIYFKRQDYLFNRLLLERYLNKYHFKRTKIIKSKDNFYKERKHIFNIDNKYISEDEYLKERYGKK